MRANTREVAAALIAAGVDPQRSILFVQSNVPAHAQLAWVLELRQPDGLAQPHDPVQGEGGQGPRERAGRPVHLSRSCMAADILAYQATHVPVGEDQKQHLELARDIAGSFNRRFGVELFPLPEPMILGEATRVMSLRDGTKKMSKSDPSEQSRISLTDDADTIALKFRRAKSDSIAGHQLRPGEPARGLQPADHLRGAGRAAAGRGRGSVYAGASFSDFKSHLADLAVEKLAPIAGEMRRLQADPGHLDRILRDGAERAAAQAEQVLARGLRRGRLPATALSGRRRTRLPRPLAALTSRS